MGQRGNRVARLDRPIGRVSLVVALVVLVGALASGRAPARVLAQDDGGVTTVTGSVTLTNPFLLANLKQSYALLLDMTAYVERDRTLAPSLQSQIAAPLEGDLATGATFALNLPIAPKGTINDVDQGEGGSGVQIYSVEYTSNLFGDPFVGPHEGGGWGTALSSLVVTVGANEVIDGNVVVWAPDGDQFFPTELGPDGHFLTDDDPVGPIPAGWTVVDLNEQPFRQIRGPEVEVPIVEGDDGFYDYGQLSFTEAFDQLIDELELRYPFTELKGIDWAALRADYRPRVEQAEADQDLYAFNLAIFDFSLAFNDGHVGASPPPELAAERLGGRLGMRLAETESGEVIVISVTEGLPADLAGIELGAVVTTWDGRPVTEAVGEELLLFSASTDFARRLQQYEFLTRGALGETVTVAFRNDGGEEQTADLTFSEDIDGRDFAANTSVSLDNLNDGQLPLDAQLLPSGIGYIRISTFDTDPVMLSSAWESALNNFVVVGATALIVDVRDNPGGLGVTPLYLAGSFYDEPFELDRNEFVDEQGVAVDVGADDVLPAPVQWDLPVAVLVDHDCASACEIFAAAMAENPDHLIVGYTPSAGVEASVYAWILPGDVFFQSSIGRLSRDGQIYLEGVGVPPNVPVAATRENLLNPEDEVLAAAEEALGPAIEAAFAEAEAETGTPEAEASPAATPDDATPIADTPSVEATPGQ